MTIDKNKTNICFNDIYNIVKNELKNIGVLEFETDARDLCIYFLGENFNLNKEKIVDKNIINKFIEAIEARKNGDTIETITNVKYFFEGEFYVNKNVLTPRFDTERLLEFVIDYYDNDSDFYFADLCCGTGCVGVSLLNRFVNAKCDFYDISNDAKNCTTINIKKYNKEGASSVNISDMFNDFISKDYDFIISNPPYIALNDYKNLSSDVLLNDPMLALVGDDNGMFFYNEIKNNAFKYIKNNGLLIIEFGVNQHNDIENIFKCEKYVKIKDIIDYNNIVRGMVFKIKNG